MRNFVRAEFPGQSPRRDRTVLSLSLALLLSLVLESAPAQAELKSAASGKTAPTTKVAEPKAEVPNNPDALPPGFKPPPEPLAIMDLERPISTKDELTKLNKEAVPKFSKVKLEANVGEAERKIIEGFVRYRLAYMTMLPKDKKDDFIKDTQEKLPQLHRQFLTEISTTGINKPAAATLAINKAIGDEIIKQMPELLKNNFYVRLHAIMILGEMDYAPAYALLLQVIQASDIHEDPENGQPEALKIVAANGLIRCLTFPQPPALVRDRTTIAHAIVGELMKPKNHPWYQVRLIEVLRHCEISGVGAGNNSKPFVVDALIAIIKDTQRPTVVRAKACYAIGRVPLPSSVKVEDIVAAIAECAWQLATAAAEKPTNPIWKDVFTDVYLAFHPLDKKDQDVEKTRPGGLLELASAKSVATPAYQAIVPIVNDVLNGKAPNAGNLEKLKNYVKPK